MPTRSAFRTVGLAHKLLAAMESVGYTPAYINDLAEKPHLLAQMFAVQFGHASVVVRRLEVKDADQKVLVIRIDDLPWPVRLVNLMRCNNIWTVKDLVTLSSMEALALSEKVRKSDMEAVIEFMEKHGLGWGVRLMDQVVVEAGVPASIIKPRLQDNFVE